MCACYSVGFHAPVVCYLFSDKLSKYLIEVNQYIVSIDELTHRHWT